MTCILCHTPYLSIDLPAEMALVSIADKFQSLVVGRLILPFVVQKMSSILIIFVVVYVYGLRPILGRLGLCCQQDRGMRPGVGMAGVGGIPTIANCY